MLHLRAAESIIRYYVGVKVFSVARRPSASRGGGGPDGGRVSRRAAAAGGTSLRSNLPLQRRPSEAKTSYYP